MSVLLLNKSWLALDVVSNQTAVNLLIRETARPTSVGPEFMETLPNDDVGLISYRTTRGLYVFNDVLVVDTSYFRKRRLPYPSRNVIFTRDGNTCQYCGLSMYRYDCTLDHVVPQCKDGKDSYENLVCSCVKCNRAKGNSDLEDFLLRTGYVETFQMPKKPRLELALFYRQSKPHWTMYLFY